MTKNELAAYIDHTNLKATATTQDIEKLCTQAAEYHFASVCVNPCYVQWAANFLAETSVKICSVCGFPLGATQSEIKVAEAALLVQKGADEVDMVINIGAALSGNWDLVQNEIALIKNAIGVHTLKVILETCYLTDEMVRKGCNIAMHSGADYIKTSTGFGSTGASVDVVGKMRAASGSAKIKAAGEIRSLSTALAMIKAGAHRLGTSASLSILEELENQQ